MIFTALLISFNFPVICPLASCMRKIRRSCCGQIMYFIRKQKLDLFLKDFPEDVERVFYYSWDFFVAIVSLLCSERKSDLCVIGHYRVITPLCFLSTEDTVPKKVVCHFNGKTYADEERWDIDSCTHCYCLQGQTLCSTVSCPPLPCAEPINVEGSCCPMCPGNVAAQLRLL